MSSFEAFHCGVTCGVQEYSCSLSLEIHVAKQVLVKVLVLSVYCNCLSNSKLLHWKENDVEADVRRALCHVSSNNIRAVGCVLIMLQALHNGSAFHKLNDFFINPYPVLNLFVSL